MAEKYDLIIAGGGLVGASLACALADLAPKVAVVEAQPWDSKLQPSFDERTIALTWNARSVYQSMGLWQQIENAGATPINDIHISNRGHFGVTHLSHLDIGTKALGYVVPTRVLGSVLHQRMQAAKNISLLCPAQVMNSQCNADEAWVEIQHDSKQSVCITAELLVIADGGRSELSNALNETKKTYSQMAIIAFIETDQDHQNRAYERFTPEGPLALLPLDRKRYAVVWTTEKNNVDERINLPPELFLQQLQGVFGDRAGNFLKVSKPQAYPLFQGSLESAVSDRQVVIGNAAHVVHPVAGQGFNLSLRDIACLAELIFRHHVGQQDCGSQTLLDQYASARKPDISKVSQFTDGMLRIFSNEIPGLTQSRNLALAAIELLPPLKRMLLKRTMGLHRNPWLMANGVQLKTIARNTPE